MSLGRRVFLVYSLLLVVLGGVTLHLYERNREHQFQLVRNSLIAQGELLARILPDNDLSRFQATIQATQVGTGAEITILDAEGRPLRGAASQEVPAGVVGIHPNPAPKARKRDVPHNYSVKVMEKPVQDRLPGESPTVTTLQLVIPTSGERRVLLERPLLDLELQALDLQLKVTVAALSLLGLVALGGYSVGRWVTRPMDHLVNFSRSLAKDEAPALLSPTGIPELDTLAESLQEMAQKIEERENTLKQFVADASHELRTPIASFKALVEALVQGGSEDPEQRKLFLSRLNQDTARLASLVESLLTLQRLEAGWKPDPISFDLGELVEELVTDVKVEAPDEGPYVDADPEQIRQVLINLITNARNATAELEEAKIAVRVRRDGTVEVCDNGPGIPPGEQTKIFERFYRVDKGRTRATGGSGLGLPISRTILSAHSAHLSVSSEPYRETRFSFKLPLSILSGLNDSVNPHTTKTKTQCSPLMG